MSNNTFPKQLKLDKWYTKQSDLPDEATNSLFCVKVKDLETSEIFYSLAMFEYRPHTYDKWHFICGATCLARENIENIYEVIAWSKILPPKK